MVSVASSSGLPANKKNFTFLAIASDRVNHTASATIDIRRLASSSDIPIFTQPLYRVSVREDTTVGRRIAVISASPASSYAIDGGNVGDVFQIDAAGSLTVARQLDREVINSYLLRVTAVGDAYATIQVVITVEDVNDERPTFQQSVVNISVLETVTGSFYTVYATDGDSGVNGTVRYLLDQSVDSSRYFEVCTFSIFRR